MSLHQDLERILDVVKRIDPSFATVDPARIDAHIEDAKFQASRNAKERFLLSAMRLMALPQNGHTRLIPNDAISVLPLRFVTLGRSVFLTKSAPPLRTVAPCKLVAVNDTGVEEIEHAATGLLAGTPQRHRVIGPLLLAWPAALEHLGLALKGLRTRYDLQSADGATTSVEVGHDDCVVASDLYPRNEHGQVGLVWDHNGFAELQDHGPSGASVKLPSFFDPDKSAFPQAMERAATWVRSRPGRVLVIDVRGNTGGDFLVTMPLIDAIADTTERRGCAVLVDKFTFSAAIVFVAILKYRLGRKLKIVGEDMGDGLKFFAEGGLIDLPTSGAVVRYSSAFHDWETGSTDQTTPPDIAREIVPAHRLDIDRAWVSSPFDTTPEHVVYQSLVNDLASR